MVRHQAYADRPDRWVRAFLLIQEDLVRFLENVEPADENQNTYSLRSADLLIRVCIEVEANLTAILRANTYKKRGDLNMKDDYFKIEKSHYLSQFSVQFPHWEGSLRTRMPFKAWGGAEYETLPWYGAYNSVKHDRTENLAKASFLQLTDAWCGLVAILSAQFLFEDFSPRPDALLIEGPGVFDLGFDAAIGSYLGVELPDKVPEDHQYEFVWSDLDGLANPFAKYNYDST